MSEFSEWREGLDSQVKTLQGLPEYAKRLRDLADWEEIRREDAAWLRKLASLLDPTEGL